MKASFSLAYGDTLFGKSSFLSSVLKYILTEEPEALARLITAENYEVLLPWINAGVLQVWPINTRQEPFDTIALAAMGFWPEDPFDPASKLTPPDKQKDFSRIRAFLFEGMSTFADLMMGGYVKGGLAARAGRGEKLGATEDTTSFKDGGSAVGGNARTHYNVTQKWVHGAVVKSMALPYHKVWTAHEVVAKDDRSQKLILGPQIVGTAATPEATRWFGNTLHVYRADQKVIKGKEPLLVSEYRVYLKSHYVEEIPNIPYKAGMRVPPEIQGEIENIIPSYILNNKESFSEIVRIRGEIDALSEKLIGQIRQGGLK